MRSRAAALLILAAACGGSPFPQGRANPDGGDPMPDGSIDAGHPGGDGGNDGGAMGGGGTADGGSAADAGPADGGTDAGTAYLHDPSQILQENRLPGDSNWRSVNATGQILAYADRVSALPGEQVTIHAGANTATTATWELWRLGYYGGQGGRRMVSGGTVNVPQWTAGIMDPQTGSVSAQWPATFTLEVPADAVTGVFVVKLTSSVGGTYVTFVVREPGPGAAIVYPIPVNTYAAYNDWGGTSLYGNRRSDWTPWHAFAVSFDRPYQNNGLGEVLSMDRGLITFVEAQGYDVTYVTDQDIDADPSLTADRRMLLYAAHTEYWTANMRQAALDAIASGTNVAFMGSNSAYWQVRYADASRRNLIGYKEFASRDPAMTLDPAHVTTKWRNAPLNAPENAMEGAMFGSWTWSSSPLTVTDSTNWLWTGAGVQNGSIIAGVYGTETDRRYPNGLTPDGIEVIANSLVEDHNATFNPAESTLYQSAGGGLVFDASSITFTRALTLAGRWDARIQQLAANLFSRFSGDGRLPAPLAPMQLPAGLPKPSWRTGVTVSTLTTSLTLPTAVAAAANGCAVIADGDRIVRVTQQGQVSVVAGSTAGFADGAAASAQFSGPRGVAVAGDGTIYVADSGNHRIRAIANGTVRTVAGSTQGFAEGTSAQFSQPMGVAVSSTGTILVADTWNQRIREIASNGSVSTWVGSGSEGIVDGAGAAAQLQFPMNLTVLPGGDALFVEPSTGTLRKVSATAPHTVTTLIGYPGDEGWNDGTLSSATVFTTIGAAARSDGQIFLVDQATARIRSLHDGIVDTVAGGEAGGVVDGPGATAGFAAPAAVAVAADGSLLVVDSTAHALRRITLQ